MKKATCPECGSEDLEERREIADYISSGNYDVPGDWETIGYEYRCQECGRTFIFNN